jgi:alkylation response protein AidB-like acyl-CoA dehydrogenase
MDLEYGEKYEAFRHEVRSFIEKNKHRVPRGQRGGLVAGAQVREWQQLLIEHGYAARTIPREYGGYGAEPDILASVIIDEEFTRARVPRGLSGQGIGMLVPTLLEHGTEEQKRRWIAPTIRGETLWCQGYSEPEAGSDLASLQTSAVEDGDSFVVNGQKIWTSTAQISQMMFALVRTEPEARKHAGISYLLIPMDTPGLEISPLKTMTGGEEFNQVFLTNVRVPAENLVGQRGEGWKIGNTTLKHERNMLGSASQTEELFWGLVDRMQAERIDGETALADPVLRDRLVGLYARVQAMKYHSMRLLTCQLKQEWPGVAALIVKLNGCELNHQIAALALDAMGDLGSLYYRSKYERSGGMWQFQYMFSLGLIIGGGTAQIQKNIISERGLGLPREPRVPEKR